MADKVNKDNFTDLIEMADEMLAELNDAPADTSNDSGKWEVTNSSGDVVTLGNGNDIITK